MRLHKQNGYIDYVIPMPRPGKPRPPINDDPRYAGGVLEGCHLYTTYAVLCGKYVKIGISCNPIRRAYTIQTYNPHEVKLVGVCHDKDESFHHKKLKNYHVRGEWYKVSRNVRNHLKKYFRPL